MAEAKDVAVNVLTSTITTLVIIFLLIPLLKIPVPAVKETETVKEKYYYPYVMPVQVEGDYSTWTIYDSFDDQHVYDCYYTQWALANQEETEFLLIETGYSFNDIKKYTIATKTLSPPISNHTLAGEGAARSIFGTYACTIKWVGEHGVGIGIWKNGDLIQSFSEADLGLTANTVDSVSISPSGKYIIVSGKRAATGNMGWVVLVGS
jgi:hypothetical protein